MPDIGTIHVAGAPGDEIADVQKCSRCGEILIDYRNTMTLGGKHVGLSGWSVGSFVTVYGDPRGASQWVTGAQDDSVHCGGKAS